MADPGGTAGVGLILGILWPGLSSLPEVCGFCGGEAPGTISGTVSPGGKGITGFGGVGTEPGFAATPGTTGGTIMPVEPAV